MSCSLFTSVFVSKPTDLKASKVTFKSVRVDWNPVPESFILGYRVLVQNIPLDETLPWNKTYANIAGLRSNTTYIISVIPVHGLTDKKYPAGNAGSIIITTKKELGKLSGLRFFNLKLFLALFHLIHHSEIKHDTDLFYNPCLYNKHSRSPLNVTITKS